MPVQAYLYPIVVMLHYIIGMRHNVLFLSVCTDGATFHSRGNQSWSPYTATCFNLPPWLRSKFGCMLLFGVMPNKIRDYARTRTL